MFTRFPEADVFRVDKKFIQEANRAELKRVIDAQMALEKLRVSNIVQQEHFPVFQTFAKTHAAEELAGAAGEILLFYEKVPDGKIGFLESFSLTPLGDIPGTWYRIMIDDEPIDGFPDADGKITRAIGQFTEPRALIPPIVVFKSLKVYAGNTLAASWTAGFSCEGVHGDKPRIIGERTPLADAQSIKAFIRRG